MEYPIEDSIVTHCIDLKPVGSRRTCNPAPEETDDDYLLLIENHMTFDALVTENGYRIGGSDLTDSPIDEPDSVFVSYTKDSVNLIATKSPVFFKRFMAATAVSKRLNLMNKEDRIALFQAVLYANDYAPPEPIKYDYSMPVFGVPPAAPLASDALDFI